MKVKIGNYPKWIGPYQIANWLKFFGVSDEKCDNIGKWLCDTWVEKITQWIYDKRKRVVDVRVDDYDTWNADHTLSLIILPILVKMKECKIGAPYVENEDVPEEFHTDESYYDEEYDKTRARWEYVLGEMIFAFDQIATDSVDMAGYDEKTGTYDKEKHDLHYKRVKNGLRLFGKYYMSLWS